MNIQSKLYEVTKIPDLTLSKYEALEESGVEGVLKKHKSFLRQIHRTALLSNQSIHWIYEYDPERPKGKRLRIFIRFDGGTANDYTDILIKNSPLSPYFDISPSENAINQNTYRYMAILIKKEKFSLADRHDTGYFYSVNKWAMNEDARLYSLLTMLQNMNSRCIYCADVLPVDFSGTIEQPDMLGNIMRALRNMLTVRVEKSGSITSLQHDESADYTLERYKDLIKDISANPHFIANIRVYADSPEYAGMLIDAAASDALDEGSHDILLNTGNFSPSIEGSQVRDFCDPKTPRELKFWPVLFMLKELVPFVTLPALYPGESIEMPKETAPNYDSQGLLLGKDNDDYEVHIPLKNLPKHVFIAGVPGSGKTNSMLHIATELHRYSIPFLIFEPVKQEYRALLNLPEMSDVMLFSPSSGTCFPLHINPFQFPKGMSLSEHIRRLFAVFEGAFYLPPPAPYLLERAIERVYREKNWLPEMKNSGKLKYPTMRELYDAMEVILDETEYEAEVKSNMKSIIQVRIGSLISREMGDLFDVEYSTLEPEEWLTNSAVIELEAMGSGPANFLTLMLSTLIRETLKISPNTKSEEERPRHVIFFEEAHNLIGPKAIDNTGEDTNPKNAATAFIVKMLAEVRALNEAIIIADQLPTVMAPEVIKNTSLKIGHRITAQDDRSLLGSTMSADGVQLERMATFTTGRALAVYEGLLKPFELNISKWQANDDLYLSLPDNELFAAMYKNKIFRYKVIARSIEINKAKFISRWENITRVYGSELQESIQDLRALQAELAEYRIQAEQRKLTPQSQTAANIDISAMVEAVNEQAVIIQNAYNNILSGYFDVILSVRAYQDKNKIFYESLQSLKEKFSLEAGEYITQMEGQGFNCDNALFEKFAAKMALWGEN